MKKRIYLNISFLASSAVLCVSVLLVTIFYNFYINEQKRSIKDYSHIMVNVLETIELENFESITNIGNSGYRLTIVETNGKVVFDTATDPEYLDNHIEREEIIEALEQGYGESIRYSTTIERNTYYYAILLPNNLILRISRDIDTMISVFIRIIPGIFLIIVSILIISFIIAPALTRKILKPLEETTLNIEGIISGKELREVNTYDELLPFIQAVSKQNQEIKKYIKALKERANTMEAITSNMNEGLIIVDKNKNILLANPSSIRILGGIERLSYTNNSFIRLCRNMEINEALHDCINLVESRDITINLSDKYLNILINPIMDEGSILGALILVVDYTEKHMLEMARREFSSNVSHELKTPLTIINGYAEMIETGMVKQDDIKRFSRIIREEGTRLLYLIDSIMKLSKIEEKQVKEYFPIDVYSIAKDTVNKLSIAALDKNIDLKVSGNEAIINGNQTMIEELLYNLIDNGIKYTRPFGRVSVSIEKYEDYCYIKVSDTGIGIPKKDQDRVFERFYTVDKSRSRKTQSTGLGLSIVKHIVEYHNGTIELRSEENKGTEITVILPSNF
ncbi:MAG: GHKL domain-containing protein [Clostridiales bacterium]|nr:GHKL domain-containing protein [Clostridiales bacterium]